MARSSPRPDAAVRRRLDAFLDEAGLAAAWFGTPQNFAWLTGGDNVVDRSAPVGVAAAGYTADGELLVVTDDIEADRLRDEELPDDAHVVRFPWHDDTLADAVADATPVPAAADFDVPGLERLDAGALRRPLTESGVERYRALGATVARTVEAVCRGVAHDDTERDVAARLRGRLAEHGVDAPVALVGGANRARRYRHYTPTDASLGAYTLVSVTASRGGLHASCTRTVAFDPPPWLGERHRAAARVEATALAATRAAGRRTGRSAGDNTAGSVFRAIQGAYAEVGWPAEWRRHHQGGATGYAGREWIARPGADVPVTLDTAYAWNPTVEGAKSEDTVLVSDDGFEVLTAGDDAWPTLDASAVGYEETLTRPAVLRR